jgi:hypothetical protein
MEAKNFLLSKTLWVNLMALAVTHFGISELVDPEVQMELVVSVLAIVNIGLRFVTKKPVKLT